jgi:hypothetical protein
MSGVSFNSKASVTGYVQTALYSAGEFLRSKINQPLFEQARRDRVISETYRPIVINLFSIVDNSSVGWFSSKHISIFSDLAPKPAPAEKLSKEEEERRRKESEDRWNKALGSAITLVAAFLTGFTYNEFSTQSATLNLSEQALTACTYVKGPIQNSLAYLIKEQLAIDNLNYEKAKNYCISSAAALVGGGAWALGGFTSLPHVSTAGKVVSLLAAGWALINLGTHWKDDQKIRQHCLNIAGDGHTHMGWANHILYHDLPNYPDNMQPAWYRNPAEYVIPPEEYQGNVNGAYVPLYADLFDKDRPAPSAPPLF